ncbi:phosphotransferase [Tateyamaria sp. syn59]|uniref:phosphotransferase n=1 Tax=Tateyamaria sp. syn59 TaxID=2576942 RepID=UPI0016735D01|nr:phosphotransferase [Tateyamaria sp. syn59]
MQLHPDAALAMREPELPGLAGVLHAPAIAMRAGLKGLRTSYLLYKPWTSCVAGLMPEDGTLGAWTAASYTTARYREVRDRPAWQNGVIFLDDVQTVLVPLSLMRRPKAARALADPSSREALLARMGLSGCTLKLLRFKPGRRLVLRADGPDGPRALLKLHAHPDAFARALAGARAGEAAGGAPLLSVSAEDGAIATQWIPGQTLDEDASLDNYVQAGRALAAAHKMAPPMDLPRLRPVEADAVAERLGWLAPELDEAARDVAARMPVLPGGPATALHGDFSADQIVCGPEGPRILDWDRACIGPAAHDIGTALAVLDLDRLRGVDGTDAAGDALIAGYRAAGGSASDADIATYRAHVLMSRATDGFRARRPGWDREIAAVLNQITAVLDGGYPSTPHLAAALDPRACATAFAANKATLTRLKPHRRAMIRYEGSVRAVLGKLRAKGHDDTAPRIQSGLRAAGLNGRDGIGVPRVVGVAEDIPVWFQEEVYGTPLGQLIATPHAASAMRKTGRALAALHCTAPQTNRHWSHDNELAVLSRAVLDGPEADLAWLASECMATLPPAVDVGLHRDFYFDQIIVGPETTWLVDLDLHAIGDAAIDLGNFIAHLTELDLRRGGDGHAYDDLVRDFLEGYAELRTLPDPHRIDTMRWVSLARHVAIAVRFADRRAAVPAIAALCRDRLNRAGQPTLREAV